MFNPNRRKKSLPKESRTIPRRDDEGIWFTCWVCGFANKEGRSALGGSASPSGVKHTGAIIPSDSDTNSVAVLGGSINHHHVALENGSDGTPKGIPHVHSDDISTGCPMCGSLNWLGKN